MAEILSGKKLASEIRNEVAAEVTNLTEQGITPCLSIVVATEDETANFYVSHIERTANKVGVKASTVRLGVKASTTELARELNRLADDPTVHGIILQTPLPEGANADELRAIIPPKKDVDGANPLSMGRIVSGLPAFAPTTAVAVMDILRRYEIPISGTRTVIIGRSLVVGKPLAHLMLDANATVTICHSKTRDLPAVAREADILVVAIGQPEMIGADYVKPHSIVIDVGTNVLQDGTLVGDVDALSVQKVAGAYTPVPGGVGPVTTAILLKQTVTAAAFVKTLANPS